jgi:hypothetical protein
MTGGQRGGTDRIQAVTQDSLVYFNSNDFHGHQFLTNDAIEAGYTSRAVKRDPSFVEKGVASLVEQDIPIMAIAAEDSLLRVLVFHLAARTTAKNMLAARVAVNSGIAIEWSSKENEWLFASLVEKLDRIPPDCHGPAELRSFLAGLPDVPIGAFHGHDGTDVATEPKAASSVEDAEVMIPAGDALEYQVSDADPSVLLSADEDDFIADMAADGTSPSNDAIDVGDLDADEWAEGEDSMSLMPAADEWSDGEDSMSLMPADASDMQIAEEGSLDRFFVTKDEYSVITNDGTASGELRGELFVQELVATLLWASTSERASVIQNEFVSLFNALNETSSTGGNGDGEDESSMPTFAGSDGSDDDLNKNSADARPTLTLSEKEQLESNLAQLGTDLCDTNTALRQLAESAKRITSKLMDQGTMDGLEGRVSVVLQEELAGHVDAHLVNLNNLPPVERGNSPRDLMLGDDRGDEPYEETLERMEEEWGEWWDEDFVWSAETAGRGKSLSRGHFDDSGANVLDAFDDTVDTFDADMERMDREWAAWDDV